MTAGTPAMIYDARTPIAVFLGPSLDLATARSVLPANYYPPVRVGDIYRLLATGVRLMVIIDGVFHASSRCGSGRSWRRSRRALPLLVRVAWAPCARQSWRRMA